MQVCRAGNSDCEVECSVPAWFLHGCVEKGHFSTVSLLVLLPVETRCADSGGNFEARFNANLFIKNPKSSKGKRILEYS